MTQHFLIVLLFTLTAMIPAGYGAGWGAYTQSSAPTVTVSVLTTSAPTTTEAPPGINVTVTEAGIGSDTLVIYLLCDALLLCGAALFAGLTLSVMGLDTLSLEIIATSGQEPDKSDAAQILPIRLKGNQLLCTLVLGNVMVNTLIAQITDRFATGWVGVLLSTALITLGGEILPQATMAAHALKVGARSVPIVKVFLVLFYPVCKPLSMFLNWAIGVDPGQVYQREELKKLFALHAKQHSDESGIHSSDVDLIVGAMGLRSTTVESVMTPISDVFMIEASERLDAKTMQRIWQAGHSRIPVYKFKRTNIIGLLYAKDLLMVRPEEGARVHDVAKFHRRSLLQATSTTTLITMMKDFQFGSSHIALVKRVAVRGDQDPVLETVGVVTLDDVIASLIGDEGMDQNQFDDNAEDDFPTTSVGWHVGGQLVTTSAALMYGSDNARGDRGPTVGLSGNTLRLIRAATMTANHRKAIAYFLRESFAQFRGISSESVMEFIHDKGLFYDITAPSSARGLHLSSRHNAWIYRTGNASNFFTLVVHGGVQVVLSAVKSGPGTQPLFMELPPWSCLGGPVVEEAANRQGAQRNRYIPDYGARVVSSATVLQFHLLDLVELFNRSDETVET